MSKTKAPEVVELSTAQLEELLAKLAQLLPAELYQLVEKLLRTLQWVMGVLQAKEITLGRLRRMIFGAKTEKSHNLLAEVGGAKPQAPKPKAKGHGRKAAQDYPGAKRQPVPHPTLHLGQLCPKCLKGKLYTTRGLFYYLCLWEQLEIPSEQRGEGRRMLVMRRGDGLEDGGFHCCEVRMILRV